MSINWKEGLRRVWWAFAAIYFVLGLIYFFTALRGDGSFVLKEWVPCIVIFFIPVAIYLFLKWLNGINWKKGLKRVWLVFAVVWWIAGIASFFFLYSKGAFSEYANIKWGLGHLMWGKMSVYILIAVLFPLVLLGLFKFVIWIKKDSTEDKE